MASTTDVLPVTPSLCQPHRDDPHTPRSRSSFHTAFNRWAKSTAAAFIRSLTWVIPFVESAIARTRYTAPCAQCTWSQINLSSDQPWRSLCNSVRSLVGTWVPRILICQENVPRTMQLCAGRWPAHVDRLLEILQVSRFLHPRRNPLASPVRRLSQYLGHCVRSMLK